MSLSSPFPDTVLGMLVSMLDVEISVVDVAVVILDSDVEDISEEEDVVCELWEDCEVD